MKKRKNIQFKSSRKKFAHNQYWVLHYTECYKDKSERDFKVFLKAKSAKLALEILDLKLSENKNFSKRKASHIYILHKKYGKHSVGSSRIVFWDAVRSTAFPNEFDKLFKIEKKRFEGQIGRRNWSPPKNYKKSDEEIRVFIEAGREHNRNKTKNWFSALSKYGKSHSDRRGRTNYNDSEVAKKELESILFVMDGTKGNVNHAKDILRISHRSLMNRMIFFEEIDWKKRYPNPPSRDPVYDPDKLEMGKIKALETRKKNGNLMPSNLKDPKVRKKMLETRKKNNKIRLALRLEKLKPKLEESLKRNNHLLKSVAKEFGVAVNTLRRTMNQMGSAYPDFKRDFLDSVDEIRLANRLSARKTNRIKYAKEMKSSILEAYHQNNKVALQAAKYLNMPISNYVRLFKFIKKNEI